MSNQDLTILSCPVSDILLETDHSTQTKAERWQLIDRLEAKIHRFEGWQNAYQGTELGRFATVQLQALRVKKFAVWNSLHPMFHHLIQIGTYAG